PPHVSRSTRSWTRQSQISGAGRSGGLIAREDAAAQGPGASRPWLACVRLLEPGRRSQAMRQTPALSRLRPEPTKPADTATAKVFGFSSTACLLAKQPA